MSDTTKFEEMVAALDLEALPESEQNELMLELNEIIVKSSLVRMIEGMDEQTREDFAALMEKEAGDEELEAFIAERVPGADQAVSEAVESLSDDILAASDTD